MNEQQFDHLLLDYVDGTLAAEERERVDVYLVSSPEASQQLTELQKSIRLVRSHLSLVEPSASLDQSILRAAQQAVVPSVVSRKSTVLEQDPISSPWWMRLFSSPSFKPVVAFCTVFLVVGSVFLVARQQELRSPAMHDKTYQHQPPSVTGVPVTSTPAASAKSSEKAPAPVLQMPVPQASPRQEPVIQPSSPRMAPEETSVVVKSPPPDSVRKRKPKKVSDRFASDEPEMRFAPPPPGRQPAVIPESGDNSSPRRRGISKSQGMGREHTPGDQDDSSLGSRRALSVSPSKQKTAQLRPRRKRWVSSYRRNKRYKAQKRRTRTARVFSKQPSDTKYRGFSGKKETMPQSRTVRSAQENEHLKKNGGIQDGGSGAWGEQTSPPGAQRGRNTPQAERKQETKHGTGWERPEPQVRDDAPKPVPPPAPSGGSAYAPSSNGLSRPAVSAPQPPARVPSPDFRKDPTPDPEGIGRSAWRSSGQGSRAEEDRWSFLQRAQKHDAQFQVNREKQHFDRAIVQYKAALALAQNKRKMTQVRTVYLALIRLHVQVKLTTTAQSYIQRYLGTFPTSERHHAHRQLARIYGELGDLKHYQFHWQQSQTTPSER